MSNIASFQLRNGLVPKRQNHFIPEFVVKLGNRLPTPINWSLCRSYCIRVTSQWARWRLQITSLTIVNSTVYWGADKKTSKLRVTGLCVRNSPVTGKFIPRTTGPITRKVFPFDAFIMCVRSSSSPYDENYWNVETVFSSMYAINNGRQSFCVSCNGYFSLTLTLFVK